MNHVFLYLIEYAKKDWPEGDFRRRWSLRPVPENADEFKMLNVTTHPFSIPRNVSEKNNNGERLLATDDGLFCTLITIDDPCPDRSTIPEACLLVPYSVPYSGQVKNDVVMLQPMS